MLTLNFFLLLINYLIIQSYKFFESYSPQALFFVFYMLQTMVKKILMLPHYKFSGRDRRSDALGPTRAGGPSPRVTAAEMGGCGGAQCI